MAHGWQEVPSLGLSPGEYAIVPSEWRRDVGAQLNNLASMGGDGTPAWHLYDVEAADGRRVLKVVEDRRGMEGTFDVSGQQFLVGPPDEGPRMAFNRQGAAIGSTTTLRDLTTEAVIGSWEITSLLSRNWEFRDPGGTPRISVTRQWSLGGLMYPVYALTSTDGEDVGRIDMRQRGLFYEADVTLTRSSVPAELSLALTCGIFWASSQS